MRLKTRIITIPFVILVYLMAFLGIGIHTCSASGTQDLILLVGDVSCEEIHNHSHCSDNTDCEGHHHDENCCKTTIYEVSDEQTAEVQIVLSAPFPMTLLNIFQQVDLTLSAFSESVISEYITPPLTTHSLDLSSLSIFRI